MSKHIPLCTLTLPSGKRCGCPAMRNQKFCYHHTRNHTGHERAQARDRMLERLDSKISAMNTAELLYLLHSQLSRLNKTLNRFPEIHYTLLAALERIAEISQMESTLRQQIRQNHEFMNRLVEGRLNSATWAQNTANQ